MRRIALGEPYATSVIVNGTGQYLTDGALSRRRPDLTEPEYDRCQAQLDHVEPGGPRELYSQRRLDVCSLIDEALALAPMVRRIRLRPS